MTSEAFVSRARAVDREPAEEVLVHDSIAALRPRLVALARSMGAPEPEDLTQTAIEIAIRHSEQLRDPEKLWPWAVSIQTREMFRWSRRLRRMVAGNAKSEATIEMESYADLREAIGALPPRIRACIALHYMADMTVSDTADALGTSPNTVKSQLRVGLQRLKEALQ